MNKESIIKLALENDWEFIADQPENYMISFYRNGTRINVWYTKMTVATCLNHPTKGKTQLFRKHVTQELMKEIFRKPRVHTRLGYRKKSKT